jgi:hypothetical protein
MAKILQTRIKNRFDSLANWQSEGVELLQGEIALVKVTTQQLDAATGKVIDVPAFLMKVGENDENGSPKAFSALPWLSAKAADVYDWAKEQYAKDIDVTVLTGASNTSTVKTLGTWLKLVYDKGNTNAEAISANTTAIGTLNGANTVSGSVAYKIKAAIDALDHTGTAGTNQIVKTVTQANGKVTVTYGAITEAELPNISAGKVIVTGTTTLATKLSAIDEDILDLKGRQVGHTDAQIDTRIDNKINALDVAEPTASGTSTSFIATAKQENGKIVVTKKNLPTASTSVAGIAKLGATGGAATYDAVSALTTRVGKTEEDIAGLKTSIAGGVHFRGTVSAVPTSATVTIDSKSYSAVAGDVVLYSGKEYIYTGSAWEELGDVTRIGALEDKINGLDVTATNAVATTHKFVSQVTQTDGKIAVTYTQPTASDVSYGTSSTVNAALSAHAEDIAENTAAIALLNKTDGTAGSVKKTVDDAIAALDGTSSGSGSFVTNVTQTNGIVAVTKGNLPTASTSVVGIVKLSSSTSSTSETLAATPKAVKTAYDKGADAQERVAAVEGNYMRIGTDDKLYAGKSGTDVIIFDCGGAL